MEKTKTTKFLGSFSLSKNGGAGGTTNYDDLTNKPKVNGVILSGNKTSADLGITTLTPFPSTWPTSGKFEDLLAAIRADATAVKGASFLGEVTFDDLPANLGNAEVKVEILEGTTSATKVIHAVITSGNRKPYRWEYTSWNSGNSNSGWISFQLPLTAGTGISIENNVISATGGAEKYGIKGDYASKYGIINAQNGLITYTSDSKEVTVKAGIQLLMPGSDTKTQIGSDIKYTINSTSDVTLFLADGEVKEAEGVYFQTEEPENGQEAYLAWYNPEVGKWQFKSNDDGNVWRTPTKAGPLADVHLSETGVIRVDYVGYRVLNDQIFALKSDLPVNAYTAANLVAGKNITIEEVLPEGGIDSHTMGCWHFDGNNENAATVGLMNITNGSISHYFEEGKFGKCARLAQNTVQTGWAPATVSADYSYDYWLLCTNALNIRICGMGSSTTENGKFYVLSSGKVASYIGGDPDVSKNPAVDMPLNTWMHLAYCKKDGIGHWFVNGKLIDKRADPGYLATMQISAEASNTSYRFDELRISDIARWTEDFEPPTQPYSLAVPTGKTAINNAITKTSQLTNDSGFLTELPETAVTTTTEQTITGAKTFDNAQVTVGGANLDSTKIVFKTVNATLDGVGLDYTTDEAIVNIGSSMGKTVIKGTSITDGNGNTLLTTANTPIATTSARGTVKPDGTTITITADGTISSVGGGTAVLSDNGIKGDYCTTYGVLETPNGLLINTSGMSVTLKQGVLMQLAGQEGKTLVSGDLIQTLTSTSDCDLFYISGTSTLMEVAKIVWSETEPSSLTEGVLAWWKPSNGKWKFISTDAGNVWTEAIATPIAHIHTDGTSITRIDHIGYLVNDKVLTGADIQTTFTKDTVKTTSSINAFADAVFHDIDNVVSLIPTKAVTSDNVTKIVRLTQAEYNALETKDDSTFYAIVG